VLHRGRYRLDHVDGLHHVSGIAASRRRSRYVFSMTFGVSAFAVTVIVSTPSSACGSPSLERAELAA